MRLIDHSETVPAQSLEEIARDRRARHCDELPMNFPEQSREEIAQDRNAKLNATSETQQPLDRTKVEGE